MGNGSRHRLQDFQMQLELLERQNKKLTMARGADSNEKPQDYQTLLMLLERQNKEKSMMAKGDNSNVKPQDYQTQLMLLERQNKKNLMTARRKLTMARRELEQYQRESGIMGNRVIEGLPPLDSSALERSVQDRTR